MDGDAAYLSVELAERLTLDAAPANLTLDDSESEFGAPEVLIREVVEIDEGTLHDYSSLNDSTVSNSFSFSCISVHITGSRYAHCNLMSYLVLGPWIRAIKNQNQTMVQELFLFKHVYMCSHVLQSTRRTLVLVRGSTVRSQGPIN